MKWFGDSWDAPVCSEAEHVKPPVGRMCGGCSKPILLVERGLVLPYVGPTIEGVTYWNHEAASANPLHQQIAYHVDCFIWGVLGEGKHVDRVSPSYRKGSL